MLEPETGPKNSSRRSFAGTMAHVYFSFGYMLTSAVGYAFPDWHGFTICCALIQLATLLTAFFFPESPSYLYKSGKSGKGRETLKTFAKKTGTELSENFLDEFEVNISEEKTTEVSSNKTFSIFDLFRHRRMGMVAINIGVCFLVNTLVYYGLSFNVDSLSGNLYVNNVINGAVELLAYFLCMGLMDRLGMKSNLSIIKIRIV